MGHDLFMRKCDYYFRNIRNFRLYHLLCHWIDAELSSKGVGVVKDTLNS